jgi:Tfp pilus assembly protein PilF
MVSFAACAAAAPTEDAGRPSQKSAASAHTANPVKRIVTHARPAQASHEGGDTAVSAAELFERGNFAMQVGQNAAAIATFENALRRDPGLTDAWGRLALLHLKEGHSAKSVEAFKNAKRYGDSNCGLGARGSGALLFP